MEIWHMPVVSILKQFRHPMRGVTVVAEAKTIAQLLARTVLTPALILQWHGLSGVQPASGFGAAVCASCICATFKSTICRGRPKAWKHCRIRRRICMFLHRALSKADDA
jgi:hypothetical protein